MSTICDFEEQRTILTNTQHRLSAIELGGPASHVYFVQHGSYAAQAQKLLGKEMVDKEYPMDHTHTAPFLADVVRSFSVVLLHHHSPFRRSSNIRRLRTPFYLC